MPKNVGKNLPRSCHLINALIGQIEAQAGRRVTRQKVAEMLSIRPSTLSKWTLGRTKLDQIESLLDLLILLPDAERWYKEICCVVNGSKKSNPQIRSSNKKIRQRKRI